MSHVLADMNYQYLYWLTQILRAAGALEHPRAPHNQTSSTLIDWMHQIEESDFVKLSWDVFRSHLMSERASCQYRCQHQYQY